MRSIIAIFSVLVLLLSIQTLQANAATTDELVEELGQLPKCVLTCITKALPKTTCPLTDFACLCNDKAYADFSEQCLLTSCTVREALKAEAWQYKACPVKEHNAGPLTERLAYFFVILTGILVGARFLTRFMMQNGSIGLDDWTILVSYIIMIPATAILIMMARTGMGRDIWTVAPDDITMMLKVFYIEQYLYQVVVTLTKISIVLLYLRIFPKNVSKKFSYVSWAVIGGLTAYLLAFLIVFIMECQPISYFWNQWDGEHPGYCTNVEVASKINGALNIFFDLVVFFLPIPKLMKLQVRDTKRKVGVILTFLIGIFVTVCSIIRLTYLSEVGKFTNATYHYNDVGVWTGVEAYLGIICACMPSILGPAIAFFRDTIGSKLSSRFSKSNSSGSRSRFTQDKSVTRLPSNSIEHSEGVELAKHAQKRGSTEKTSVKSIYDLPGEQSSREELDLDDHNAHRMGRDQYGV